MKKTNERTKEEGKKEGRKFERTDIFTGWFIVDSLDFLFLIVRLQLLMAKALHS